MRERFLNLVSSNTAVLGLATLLLTAVGVSAPRLAANENDCGDYICATAGDDNADCSKTGIENCTTCKKDERCASGGPLD